nr:hypothetical protein [Chloroflexota bacterium]
MTNRVALNRSDQAELWERLSTMGRVLKLQQIVTWTIRLLLVGLAIDCLWLSGSRFLPYVVPIALLPAIPLGLAALGALVLTFWRPSMAYLARQADRQLGLKERLTTAVEIQTKGEGPYLADLQLRDAVDQFRRIEPLEAFPIRIRFREANATLALALAAVLLVAWPNPMQQKVRQREQVQQTIRQEAERLNKQAEEIAALNADSPSEDLQQIEQALRDGAKALEQRGTNEEALAALAALEQRLQALQGQNGADLEEALSALAGSLAQDPSTRQAGTSLAKGDYKQAAEELRRISENLEKLSPQEQARLARSMRQAGQRASRSNPSMGQSMNQAANALEQGAQG